MTPEGKAKGPSNPESIRYPVWREIQEALTGEPDLQNESAFNRRIEQSEWLNEQHRNVVMRSIKILLFTWIAFVIAFFLAQAPWGSYSSLIGYSATFTAFTLTCSSIIRRGSEIAERWHLNISISARSAEISLLAVGVLIPFLLWYLDLIPEISGNRFTAGAVDGVWVTDATLLSALAGLAANKSISLLHRRSQRHKNPDIMLFFHLARLSKQLSATNFPYVEFSIQAELCDRIDRSIKAVDSMALALASPWRPSDEEMRQNFASIASGLRALKCEVTLPKVTYKTPAELPSLADRAAILCMICATGLYGRLPGEGGHGPSAREGRQNRILLAVKKAAAAALPLAIFLIFQGSPLFLKFNNFPHQDIVTFGLAALIWPLLYIIRLLDPDYSDILSDLKGVLSLVGR